MGDECAPKWNFSRGRRGARGEVRVAGEVVVESIFALVVVVVVRCVSVCVVDGEVKWAGGLEAARRFMFKRVTS